MGPESKMLSEISQTETFCFTYMWNLKYKSSEYNEKETDSQIQSTNQWFPLGQDQSKKLRGTDYYV